MIEDVINAIDFTENFYSVRSVDVSHTPRAIVAFRGNDAILDCDNLYLLMDAGFKILSIWTDEDVGIVYVEVQEIPLSQLIPETPPDMHRNAATGRVVLVRTPFNIDVFKQNYLHGWGK